MELAGGLLGEPPAGLLLGLGVLLAVPALRPEAADRRLDLLGAGLLVGSVMAVIVGAALVENPTSRLLGLGVGLGGAALAGLLVVHQRRVRDPLVPAAAVRDPRLRLGVGLSFVNTATTSSAGVLATLLLQQQLGATALESGLLLMPFSLAVVAGSMLSRPLGARWPGARSAAVGLAAIAVGLLVLALTYGTVVGIVVGVSVAGTGLGIASVAATSVGTDVDPAVSGSAAGLLNTGAQLGTALGVAGLVLLASAVSRPPGTAVAWAAAAVLAAATAVATLRWRPPPERSPAGQGHSAGIERPS